MKFDGSLLGGFITTTSKVYRGSYTVTCLRPNNTIKLIIVVGARSGNILRAEVSSPVIKKIETNKSITELISIVKCACSECIKILKDWDHDSTSP